MIRKENKPIKMSHENDIVYDIIIIGSGPAAYQAAIYAQEVKVLMLEGGIIGNNGPGGQLTTTTLVDNYPGFAESISGPDLMIKMKNHAMHENIVFKEETALKISETENYFVTKTKKFEYFSRSIIIATGAQAKRLNALGTDRLWQNGISSCAVCDGYMCLEKTAVVIGGGDSAMEESLHLSSIAKKVLLIHRRDKFRSRKDMFERVEKNTKIEILRSHVLVEAKGDEFLESIIVKNIKNDEIKEIQVDGLFFAIGHIPNTSFIPENFIKKDSDGYIITDEKMRTSRNGIFACGDVQDRIYRQANTAAATGCEAALSALAYLKTTKF